MNLSSALLSQIIALQETEVWASLRKDYLPLEYHTLFVVIQSHFDRYHTLPTFEDLKLSIRDPSTKEKLYAVESVETEADPAMLLEYLKNEFTQKEILKELESYLEESIAFETADESVTHLHQIVMDVEDKVDLEPPAQSMQRINLFESDEELGRYLPLGLNTEYDLENQFSPRDLILVGGRRGAGKSITCANIAHNVYERGKSVVLFTIEMDQRSQLQRLCAIATGVPYSRIRHKNMSILEWEKVAKWWADRFVDGYEKFEEYREHRSFEELHSKLMTKDELLPTCQLDIVYDPSLTLAKIQAELDKKIKSKMDVGVIIVDYLNQVKRSLMHHRGGQYDWSEQIEISKALKSMAQEYETPVFSPYQTDSTGEARFAKGILDAADAAFALEAWEPEDECITFKCVKMRSAMEQDFTSYMNWDTLKIGPESALSPLEREKESKATGEDIEDL